MSENFKLIYQNEIRPLLGLFDTYSFSSSEGTVYTDSPDEEIYEKLSKLNFKPTLLSRMATCDILPQRDLRIEWKIFRTIATIELNFEIWGDPTKFTYFFLKYGKFDVAFAQLLDDEFYKYRLTCVV